MEDPANDPEYQRALARIPEHERERFRRGGFTPFMVGPYTVFHRDYDLPQPIKTGGSVMEGDLTCRTCGSNSCGMLRTGGKMTAIFDWDSTASSFRQRSPSHYIIWCDNCDTVRTGFFQSPTHTGDRDE